MLSQNNSFTESNNKFWSKDAANNFSMWFLRVFFFTSVFDFRLNLSFPQFFTFLKDLICLIFFEAIIICIEFIDLGISEGMSFPEMFRKISVVHSITDSLMFCNRWLFETERSIQKYFRYFKSLVEHDKHFIRRDGPKSPLKKRLKHSFKKYKNVYEIFKNKLWKNYFEKLSTFAIANRCRESNYKFCSNVLLLLSMFHSIKRKVSQLLVPYYIEKSVNIFWIF